MKKRKGWRGVNPRPMVLRASALPLRPDVFCSPLRRVVSCISYYGREERKYNRSEWCSGRALAFKTIGRGFAPRQCFVFFTRRRRRLVSIYQSYYGREEIKNNRSEWCRGRALAFKTIGRGIAPRQRFFFFRRRRRVRLLVAAYDLPLTSTCENK